VNIDDLGQSASATLHAQMTDFSAPNAEWFGRTAVKDRHRRRIVIGVTALVLVLAAAGVGATARHQQTLPAGPPPGVTPKHLASGVVGFSVDVPDTWQDSSQYYGYQFSYTGPANEGFMTAGVQPSGPQASLDTLADQWLARLQPVSDPQVSARTHVLLDGKPAVELRYTAKNSGARGGLDDNTTYIVRTSTGSAIQLTVAALSPRQNQPLLDWVISTIRIS
jgi:hypothetical protein